MPHPSAVSTGVFVAIVIAVAALFVGAWGKASAGAGASRLGVPILVALGWLAIPGVLAATGRLDAYDRMPAPVMVLMAGLTVGTVILACSPVGGRLVSAMPLAGLVGFASFRVSVEWVLHRLYVEGVIPVQMTYAGRNFDIVTGVTAGIVAFLIAAGRGGRALVLIWNLLGLGLLINIIVIAVLSTPVPFRAFMNEPANRLPSMFPYVWLPTFLVQAGLFGHLLVFRALAGRKRA